MYKIINKSSVALKIENPTRGNKFAQNLIDIRVLARLALQRFFVLGYFAQ
jgi:hypothetical protein